MCCATISMAPMPAAPTWLMRLLTSSNAVPSPHSPRRGMYATWSMPTRPVAEAYTTFARRIQACR